MTPLTRLNGQIMIALADVFVSTWCFWVFLVLSLLPSFWPSSMSVVQFISSGVLQLVALPLLAYVNTKDTNRLMHLVVDMHDLVMSNVQDLHNKHDRLQEVLGANLEAEPFCERVADPPPPPVLE